MQPEFTVYTVPTPAPRRVLRHVPVATRPPLYDSTRRTEIGDNYIRIYGWPSKGGVIILDQAESVDLEFLGFDRLNPPPKRLDSQDKEDAFCQQLLLLGAKWWDSETRYLFLRAVMEGDEEAILALEGDREPAPTMKERRWVSVGWPTGGGFWVAEFDTNLWMVQEQENLVPFDTARLKLARTRDEKCQILRDHFKAKFYNRVKDYIGYASLNSWGKKVTGEVGPLKVTD